ncbi:MAG: signal peptide peptidase SppA [Vicinamibacterales bacterium]|nr:signal peptide peptidase SppA [Vicinamibacterales bacterium]
MRRGVWIVLFLVGFAVLVSAGAMATLYLAVARPAPVAAESTLVLSLNGSMPESPRSGFELLGATSPTLRETVAAIRRARDDRRVTGLLVVTDSAPSFWGQAQELRDAILDFRTSKKPTVAYLTYGGDAEYYVATACEKIYVLPTSGVALDGLAWYELFLRGTLDKLGVVPDMLHVGQYKTAVNLFTEKGFTEAHREMTQSLNQDAFAQVVAGIATARGKTEDQVRALIDEGPFLADEALRVGLVDGLAYPDELESLAGVKVTTPNIVEPRDLVAAGRAFGMGRRSRIAVLHIDGTIAGGRSGQGPDGSRVAGAASIADALQRIRKDSSFKALVVRIDSPGGSSLASDLIWRELTLTRQKMPVVASMGDLAASGGYYVAMPAATIVAQPGTLTGSIGIYTGKFALGGTLDMLGASIDGVSQGRFADMNSPVRPFSEEERERVLEQIQSFYDHFVGLVAEARKLPRERVEELAQGRVWTGRQARERGLVDELGGFDRALALAKKAAGIDEKADVDLVSYPPPRGFYDALLHPFGSVSARQQVLNVFLSEDEQRALAAITVPMRLFKRGEPLALMPYVVIR